MEWKGRGWCSGIIRGVYSNRGCKSGIGTGSRKSGFLLQKLAENVVFQPRCLQKYQMQHFVGEGEGGCGLPGGGTGSGREVKLLHPRRELEVPWPRQGNHL